MLNKPLNRINILLVFSIIALSFLTIFWHQQSYILYKTLQSVQKTNQTMTAKHKQLLSEYSEKIHGNKIHAKAINQLHMHPPTKTRELRL